MAQRGCPNTFGFLSREATEKQKCDFAFKIYMDSRYYSLKNPKILGPTNKFV